MGVTRDLTRFVAQARYEDLPPAAVDAAKMALLNILGNCVAGNRTRIGALHVEMAKDMGGGRTQATIIGDGARVSAPVAAYANGNLGFALDYEDTVKYVTHPGFITTASGLAVGELLGSSGRDLILAMALGYEIVARIGLSMQPTPERGKQVFGEQYHPFAAAVTAGKLLGLDEEQLDVAFGVAGTYSSVPSAYKYFGVVAETRPMREVKLGWGWMCMAGTLGALSAKRGFRGGHGILDGERGFHVMAGSDRCDPERMTRSLGEHWLIVDAEYKGFPAIARIIPAYFAASALVEEHRITPADVERVVVRGGQIRLVNDFNPRSAVDAQFSLPFVVVMAITREPLAPDMFSDARLFDPLVRELLGRVELDHDAEADALFFNEQRLRYSVAITLKSGASISREIEFPRDQPRFGWPELERKFRTLAGSLLPSAQVEHAIDTIRALDDLDKLDPLIASVCVARGTDNLHGEKPHGD
ncbi:MAG: MmgE/PrpD family protein [Terriglobia bacterium]